MPKQLVFDLETQRSAQEVGGWDNCHKMGMSLAVTYDLFSKEYKTYYEADVARLVDDLIAADKVIGFNIKRFDFEVLKGYCQVDYSQINTLDLLEIIHFQLGFRVSLDKLAQETLGEKKSGHGMLALRWFKEGNWQQLEEYCRQDVNVTALLYQYGQENGCLYYPSNEGKKKIVVTW